MKEIDEGLARAAALVLMFGVLCISACEDASSDTPAKYGGSPSTGGTPTSTGGNATTGGNVATGGRPATGGALATGGLPSQGGRALTGGTTSSGGTTVIGGATATGGTTPIGGNSATGGTRTTGGVTSTGGTTLRQDGGADSGGLVVLVSFSKQIQPLLQTHCVSCHGPTKQNGRPAVRVDSYNNVKASLTRVTSALVDGVMPESGPLPKSDRDMFKAWVDQGALNN